MRKRILTLVLALVLVVAVAVPAMAASGVNDNEQALLDKFSGVVDKYASAYGKHAEQYKSEAETALTKVDLDAAACDDLAAAIDAVDAILAAKPVATGADAREVLPEVLKTVNETANKYKMNVTVVDKKGDANDGFATVEILGDTVANTGSVVKQTGVDMTATIVVAAVLAVALMAGVTVVGKKKLLEK
ncbi:MAG: hypothetical protein IJ072_06735 [Oscillospiraceae bacterium]|nr:hypothetical protein [Oscillospiraceae bacterium]